jgi:hypothetical protein
MVLTITNELKYDICMFAFSPTASVNGVGVVAIQGAPSICAPVHINNTEV